MQRRGADRKTERLTAARRHTTATVAYTWKVRRLRVAGSGAHGIHPWLLHHRMRDLDEQGMAMTPEAWTIIGTGVVILIAIATSNRQLRSEMKAFREEFRGELNLVHGEIGRLRERMAKLEGLLEGLREAITGRKPA